MFRRQYGGRLRYEVIEHGSKFAVRDVSTGQLFKGRFHTEQQANDWVELQVVDYVLYMFYPDGDYASRDRAFMITSRDYYGDNEHAIKMSVH